MKTYKIINGVITNEKKEVLVVKENNLFLLPGGRPEGDETEIQTLKRELEEEVSVKVTNQKFFKAYTFPHTAKGNVLLDIKVYIVEISGEIKADNEIIEMLWVNKDNYKMDLPFPRNYSDKILKDLQEEDIIQKIIP